MPTIYPDTEQLRQKLFVARANAARRIAVLRREQAKPENAPYATYFDDQIEDIEHRGERCAGSGSLRCGHEHGDWWHQPLGSFISPPVVCGSHYKKSHFLFCHLPYYLHPCYNNH